MREMGKFRVEALGQGFQITRLFRISTGTNTCAKFVNLRPDESIQFQSHVSPLKSIRPHLIFLIFHVEKQTYSVFRPPPPPHCFNRLFSLYLLLVFQLRQAIGDLKPSNGIAHYKFLRVMTDLQFGTPCFLTPSGNF